jgi:hypothetical protein
VLNHVYLHQDQGLKNKEYLQMGKVKGIAHFNNSHVKGHLEITNLSCWIPSKKHIPTLVLQSTLEFKGGYME